MTRAAYSGGAPMRIIRVQRRRTLKRGEPAYYNVISKPQAALNLTCRLCGATFRQGDHYYLGAHVDCVTKARRTAAKMRRRE